VFLVGTKPDSCLRLQIYFVFLGYHLILGKNQREAGMRFKMMWWACLVHFVSMAQYEESGMKGVTWYSLGGGINSADYQSWNFSASMAQRGESAMVLGKFSTSHEMKSSPQDSIFSPQNSISELALLVGEAWQSKGGRVYVDCSVGMGVEYRVYGDFADGNNLETVRKTQVTMGIPGQVELGWMFHPNWGLSTQVYGNWNFRMPYAGVNLALVHRPKNIKS
jgi:hypothetical protein